MGQKLLAPNMFGAQLVNSVCNKTGTGRTLYHKGIFFLFCFERVPISYPLAFFFYFFLSFFSCLFPCCILWFLIAFPLSSSPAHSPYPRPFSSHYRLPRSWTTLTLRPRTLMFAAEPVFRQRMTSSLLARAHGWVVCHSLWDLYIPLPGILVSCFVHIQKNVLINLGFVLHIYCCTLQFYI